MRTEINNIERLVTDIREAVSSIENAMAGNWDGLANNTATDLHAALGIIGNRADDILFRLK